MKKTTKTQPSTKGAGKPELKFNWDLSDLYSSYKDPKIEQDVKLIAEKYAEFAKKYSKNKKYLTDANALHSALVDFEKMLEVCANWKPVYFLSFLNDVDSDDSEIKSKIDLITGKLIEASNATIFFELEIGRLDKKIQSTFLKNPKLAKYKYFLSHLFENAKYRLSDKEEQILSKKSIVTYDMWVKAQKKLLSNQTVTYKREQIPISKALDIKKDLPFKERLALHTQILEKVKSISFMAEAEINAIYTDKKIDDEIRGYATPYEATVKSYENDVETVDAIIDVVGKNVKISNKYFSLKAKVLGLKSLSGADVGASLDYTRFKKEKMQKKRKIPVEEAIEIIETVFSGIDPIFSGMVTEFFKNGQIDLYPKKGKRNGAYCSGVFGQKTRILANYNCTVDDVLTLAHEMGHAIHNKMAECQPVLYFSYSTSTAEVASTFFEQATLDYLLKSPKTNETEKYILLSEKIESDISTIFRQWSFFNFELELHKQIREKGGLDAKSMAGILKDEHRKVFGPIFKPHELDGYGFVWVPHFRYFFYVYTYIFGQLISKSIYNRFLKDRTYLNKFLEVLKAGGSESPKVLFARAGIDITDQSFYTDGLKSIETDIKEFERMSKIMLK